MPAGAERANHARQKSRRKLGSSPERRISAIAFMDMVGFSRLIAIDAEGTLARWVTLRRDLIESTVADHRGRIFKLIGDELMLEFHSGMDAVRCAVAMQETVRAFNEDLPPGSRMQFRIGVHLGDVIVENGDMWGHAVNIAERLRQAAEPAGIMISGTVRDQIGAELGRDFEDVGPLRLKNIPDDVRAFCWKETAAFGANKPFFPRDLANRRRASIAVLPLENLTGDASQSYISAGIVEDVIAALAKLPSILVISRNSTIAVDAAMNDPRELGKIFGVRYVLRGSYRRDGNRSVVHTELAETEGGTVIDASRHQAQSHELFVLQDELAAETVNHIVPHIEAAEMRRVIRAHPRSLDAYDLALRALAKSMTLDRGDAEEAMSFLARAVTIDISYADGYAWLAKSHILRIAQGWSSAPALDRAEASRLAKLAISCDPFGSLALAIHAHTCAFLHRDYDTAVADFDRALKASPSHPLAWAYSGLTDAYLGKAQSAKEKARFALRLSPHDVHGALLFLSLGMAQFVEGDDESAVVSLRESLRRSPSYSAAWRVLAWSLARSGRIGDARQAGSRLLALEPGFRVSAYRHQAPFAQPERREEVAELLLKSKLPP